VPGRLWVSQQRGSRLSAPLVLIADNDRAVSALLTEVLARTGLAVQPVYDGETARLRARDRDVAVLVCDLDMPRLSGIDVVESLAELADPPQVVVVSGYLDGAIQQRLSALPYVRGVLPKPFDVLAFAKRVHQLAQVGRTTAIAPSSLPQDGGAEH